MLLVVLRCLLFVVGCSSVFWALSIVRGCIELLLCVVSCLLIVLTVVVVLVFLVCGCC